MWSYRDLSGIALLFLATTPCVVNSQLDRCALGNTAQDIAALSGMNLEGKVALVTGGRSGLGRAISEALMARNCTVVIASRHELRNRFAAEDMAFNYPLAEISHMTFDLESFASVRSFASEFMEKHGRLDYYFGNAGQSELVPSGEITVDGFERIFQVNYVSQFLLVQLLLPLLRSTPGSRIILTASSTHAMACGNIGLAGRDANDEQFCFDGAIEDNAINMLPLDKAGMEAVGDWGCGYGPYSVTKFLMIQLGKELAEREAEAGNEVYPYSFAPGPITTTLLPGVFGCCIGPFDGYLGECRMDLPYVGPTDDLGNPDPPSHSVPNFWTSPEHGTMAPVFAALHADEADAGSFLATYYECVMDAGYVSQGITDTGRTLIYDLSMKWAGLDGATDAATANLAGEGPTTANLGGEGTEAELNGEYVNGEATAVNGDEAEVNGEASSVVRSSAGPMLAAIVIVSSFFQVVS